LILLHGLTQTGAGVMNINGFNDIAEQNNFIVCYPDGINNAWNANMNVSVSTADDKGFIETLAHYFQNNYNTDPRKQYLCGFSNGGFMSHKMACESSECFAAIATVSGNMSDTIYTNCNPQFSPAVLHIHGTADAVVPYNGGAATGVSVEQTMQKWANFISCDPTPVSVQMPNTNLVDLSSPERITYSNCNSLLELIKITGAGHQWPGIATLVGGAGTINMDFYSPQLIWDFLSGKSCPTNSIEEISFSEIRICPNPVKDKLTIQSSHKIDFEIYSMEGIRVLFGQNQDEINVQNLKPGIYQIALKSLINEKMLLFVKD
jgi:polyhydroxybutyrate depolymerase